MKKLKDLKQNELVCTQHNNKPWAIVKVFKPYNPKTRYAADVGRQCYSNPDELFYELHELENTKGNPCRIIINYAQFGKSPDRVVMSLTELEECWCRGHGWAVSPDTCNTAVSTNKYSNMFYIKDYLEEIQDKVEDNLWRYAIGELEELIFLSTKGNNE